MGTIIANFPLCGGCSRREKRKELRDGEYYCTVVDGILPNGVVTIDTDATKCIEEGWYKSMQNHID